MGVSAQAVASPLTHSNFPVKKRSGDKGDNRTHSSKETRIYSSFFTARGLLMIPIYII